VADPSYEFTASPGFPRKTMLPFRNPIC